MLIKVGADFCRPVLRRRGCGPTAYRTPTAPLRLLSERAKQRRSCLTLPSRRRQLSLMCRPPPRRLCRLPHHRHPARQPMSMPFHYRLPRPSSRLRPWRQRWRPAARRPRQQAGPKQMSAARRNSVRSVSLRLPSPVAFKCVYAPAGSSSLLCTQCGPAKRPLLHIHRVHVRLPINAVLVTSTNASVAADLCGLGSE